MIVSALRDAIKYVSPLSPDDSGARAVRVLRSRCLPALPVSDGQRLVGIVSDMDLVAITAGATDAAEALRSVTVGDILQPLPLIASEYQSLASVAETLREVSASIIPVSDAGGRYLGVLLPTDLLAAMAGDPVVPPVAGLATPFGVYLTTGALRVGAGDLALGATGASLMLLNIAAAAVVYGLAWLADRLIPLPDGGSEVGIATVLLFYSLQIAIFLLLLRVSPLTAVHAAEHKVVHAVEEGEDLTLQKVRHMPRVHPRCGTNLMALLIVLVIAEQLLESLGGSLGDSSRLFALLLLVMIVLLTWRRLGAGMQRWVTTRRPSDRQLTSAIEVAEDLLVKVRARPGARAGFPRRLWNSGFLQVLAGFLLVAFVAERAEPVIERIWHLLIG